MMKKQGQTLPPLVVVCFLSAFAAFNASALQPEDGPMYLTDSHGAAGVVRAILSLAEAAPEYMECAEQTLTWLMSVKRTDAQGRVSWFLSDSAPVGHKNRRVQLPGLPMAATVFLSAYEKTGKPEYKEVGIAAARWLAEVGADTWETDLGTAYGWGFSYAQKDPGLISGHSHGLGKYMTLFIRAQEVETHPSFTKALQGILVNLKTRAIDMGDGKHAWPAFKWPNLEDKNAILTGYCYGQAGVIVPLMQLSQSMPGFKLSDGTTPLELGNGGLRYLMSAARPSEGGNVWPYMRREEGSRNPGLGSGTGGIGWAFLEGHRANRGAGNEEFAEECMRYARSAAEYALWAIERAQGNVFQGGGGASGFGVCGGAGGTAYMPVMLAQEIDDEDPMFDLRVRMATKKVATMLIDSGTPADGMLVWPLRTWERKHHQIRGDTPMANMALDYGQTGVVLSLAEMGRYLKDEKILDGARKAADFIVENAVKTDDGWKLARFVEVKGE